MAGHFNGTTYEGDDTDETVTGTSANETFYGEGGSDTLHGGAGNDQIFSYDYSILDTSGVDRLYGDAGYDTLYASAFAAKGSLIDGGADIDAANIGTGYADPNTPKKSVTFKLTESGSYVTVDGKRTLLVKNAETLFFSGYGAGDANITGGDNNDYISAYGTNNVLKGLGGNDGLSASIISGGTSLIDGGAGTRDSAYLGNNDGLTLVMKGNLETGATVMADGAVVATLKGIERFTVTGGSGNDVLFGGSGDNDISGGFGGADTIQTYDGDDQILVALDDKRDVVKAGGGSDVLTLSGSAVTEAVVMSGTLGALTVKLGTATAVTASSIDVIAVRAGSGNDSVFGGTRGDSFDVAEGANTVKAGGGDDTVSLVIDQKRDVVDGGTGNNYLSLYRADVDRAVDMTLTSATGFDLTVGGVKAMHVTNMQRITVEGSTEADTLFGLSDDADLRGNDGNDVLTGGAGDDMLTGGIGNDTMNGGTGDDVLYTGEGTDTLDGGSGQDTAVFQSFRPDSGTTGITLTLVKGKTSTATFDGKTVAKLSGIENLTGTGYDDVLTGDSGNNIVTGNDGNNVLNGGAGIDTVDYGFFYNFVGTDGLTITLNGSHATTVERPDLFSGPSHDTIRNFENVIGTQENDTIIGDANANVLDGGSGVDVMTGGGGNDVFKVDNPLDVVKEAKGGGFDTVMTSSNYTLAAHQEIEVLEAVSDFLYRDISYNQTLVGNTYAQTLIGGGGNDKLTGGLGDDTFAFQVALGPNNIDTITDFRVAHDTIALDHAVFKGLKTGELAASAFYAGSQAHDTDDRIIYNKTGGTLFYDADGTGKAAAVAFAVIGNHAALTFKDFDVT